MPSVTSYYSAISSSSPVTVNSTSYATVLTSDALTSGKRYVVFCNAQMKQTAFSGSNSSYIDIQYNSSSIEESEQFFVFRSPQTGGQYSFFHVIDTTTASTVTMRAKTDAAGTFEIKTATITILDITDLEEDVDYIYSSSDPNYSNTATYTDLLTDKIQTSKKTANTWLIMTQSRALIESNDTLAEYREVWRGYQLGTNISRTNYQSNEKVILQKQFVVSVPFSVMPAYLDPTILPDDEAEKVLRVQGRDDTQRTDGTTTLDTKIFGLRLGRFSSANKSFHNGPRYLSIEDSFNTMLTINNFTILQDSTLTASEGTSQMARSLVFVYGSFVANGTSMEEKKLYPKLEWTDASSSVEELIPQSTSSNPTHHPTNEDDINPISLVYLKDQGALSATNTITMSMKNSSNASYFRDLCMVVINLGDQVTSDGDPGGRRAKLEPNGVIRRF